MAIWFAIAAIVLLVFWMISTQRKLNRMAENIHSAMRQVSVQLSSCFETLTALLGHMKGWTIPGAQTMLSTLKSRLSPLSADSAPEEVYRQVVLLCEVLGQVSTAATQCPTLEANSTYHKYMRALDNYQKMISTSRLIYNDRVSRLNRELHAFPVSLLKHLLGIEEKGYLEAVKGTSPYAQ